MSEILEVYGFDEGCRQETAPPAFVDYDLSRRELDEVRDRLVRVASMGLPLDRFGARVVLGCAHYGDADVEDVLECMSDGVRRDASAVLFLVRSKKIRIGKFISASIARKICLQRPCELLGA